MHNRSLLQWLFISCISIASACTKSTGNSDEPDAVPEYQVKGIEWSNGVSGRYVYNADNTLKQIDYSYLNVASRTAFEWSGKRLSALYDDYSSYKNVFHYDTNGKLVRMQYVEKNAPAEITYEFVFTYSNNRLDSLKRYDYNVVDRQLRAASGYHYNAGGDLEKVVTQMGASLITHRIDGWSPPVSFLPGNYIELTVNENYPVYNLALLLQLQGAHKLPARVARVVQTGADPAFTDYNQEDVYTVTNYRIDKIQHSTTYPGMPDYKPQSTSTYSY